MGLGSRFIFPRCAGNTNGVAGINSLPKVFGMVLFSWRTTSCHDFGPELTNFAAKSLPSPTTATNHPAELGLASMASMQIKPIGVPSKQRRQYLGKQPRQNCPSGGNGWATTGRPFLLKNPSTCRKFTLAWPKTGPSESLTSRARPQRASCPTAA